MWRLERIILKDCNYIMPAFLSAGDRVGIVSPAGALQHPEIVERAALLLASWGLDVTISPNALSHRGYYAGSVDERICDMRSMLNDERVKAVLCSYGGYGCVHLLPYICDDLCRNPKWILGMSDCSVLHAAALSQGMMSLHSPQCNHLAQRGSDDASHYLRQILFGELPQYSVASHPLNRCGSATGVLVGGNLSVLSALVGTPYDMFAQHRVLFIEDVNEPLYKIERMLHTLRLSGVLSSLAALVVGRFAGCKDNPDFGGTVCEVIHTMVQDYDYPVCFNFPVGHTDENYPLIVGASVDIKIEAEGVSLSFCQ